MKQRINIVKLAQHLGLSVSTVSKALNGREDVSKATKQRVLAAASELGFSPDPAGRRLRSGTSETIGFVLSYPQAHFAQPFFLDLMAVIELVETPYQLVIVTGRSIESEIDSFRRLVEQQRVDAVMFGRTRKEDARIQFLQDPAACHLPLSDEVKLAILSRSLKTALRCGRNGTARFIGLGHRRIGLLNTPDYLMLSHHLRAGYMAALDAANLSFDPALIVDGELSETGGLAGARKLLAM